MNAGCRRPLDESARVISTQARTPDPENCYGANRARLIKGQYYAPYGQIAYQTLAGAPLTSFGFTGQRLDSGSGLMCYGARYYDPVLSYFISPDGIAPNKGKPQSGDRYSYVLNNPLRYTDPTGHNPNHLPDAETNASPAEDPNSPGTPNQGNCQEAANAAACAASKDQLENVYGFHIADISTWDAHDLELILAAISDLLQATHWSIDEFKQAMGMTHGKTVTLLRKNEFIDPDTGKGLNWVTGYTAGGEITFYDANFGSHDASWSKHWAVHEMAHRLDQVVGGAFSRGMVQFANDNAPGGGSPASNYGTGKGAGEDWAEAVSASVYPDLEAFHGAHGKPRMDSFRAAWVQSVFNQPRLTGPGPGGPSHVYIQ